MNGNRLSFLLLALVGALLLTAAGCTQADQSPTPTMWYLVVTNTPLPTSTATSQAEPTQSPTPTTAASTETPTPTAMPTPPPLPTSPPTRPPTSPPLPTAIPPTAAPTTPPATAVPPQDVCQGDEQMTFDPAKPTVGEKFTIKVTSAKTHQNVRLEGPGNLNGPKVAKEGTVNVWTWTTTSSKGGRLAYTFYVENTVPCTSNRVTVDPPAPQPGISLSCANPNVKGNPGETVKIMVTMQNTGNAAGTFNVDIDKSGVPAGWQAVFCLTGVCYEDGPVPHPLAAGASDKIEVDVMIPAGATAGTTANVKITVISQHDSNVKDTIKVSVTSK